MSDTTIIKLEQIKSTYQFLLKEIDAIQTLQDDLKIAGLCNGTAYWRNEDGKPKRLYANHGEGTYCDLHGQKKGRLRKYIGSDPEKMNVVLEAMKRYQEWKQLEKQKYDIESKVFYIRNAVSNIR